MQPKKSANYEKCWRRNNEGGNSQFAGIGRALSIIFFIGGLLLASLVTSPPAEGKFLQGGVQHSEMLTPIAPSLRPGEVYNGTPQQAKFALGRWYRIPTWYAGRWHRDYDTKTFSQSYVTGEISRRKWVFPDRCTAHHGHQQDRSGVIWECSDAMGQGIGEGDVDITYQNVREYEPLEVTDNKVVFRVLLDNILVDKNSGRILTAKQTENVQEYTLSENPNIVRVEASVKVFDANGKPLSLEESHTELIRIGPFEPRPADPQGRDLHAMFKTYLHSQNLDQLIPIN